MNCVKANKIITKVVILAFIFLSLFSLCSCGIIDNFKTPPEPEIRYGEFPFTVVYEKNGEKMTYKDTLICEYVGVKWDDVIMRRARAWRKTYASGHKILLLEIDHNKRLELRGGPTAAYLMDDKDSRKYKFDNFQFWTVTTDENGHERYSQPNWLEVYEQYGIKLIDYDIALPIENSFQ